jgi:phosphoribosylanthranilate isomerase
MNIPMTAGTTTLAKVRTRIKVCGLTRIADAEAAVMHGADALGLIFWKPSPRYIDPLAARPLVSCAGPFVATVGVFVNPTRDEVLRAIEQAGISTLQFHGEEDPDFCASFQRPWIKAFKVGQPVSQVLPRKSASVPGGEQGDLLESTLSYQAASAWLFDAFDARLVGGTGEAFDWNLVPKNLARPLVLSGGLNVSNVGDAVRRLRPYAVDVSSGVELDKGIKYAGRIAAFIHGVRDADQ